MLKVIALNSMEPSSETATALGTRFSLSHPAAKNSTNTIPINFTHICRQAHTRHRERQPTPVRTRFFDIAKSPPNPHLADVVTTVGGFGELLPCHHATGRIPRHLTHRAMAIDWKTTPAPSPFFTLPLDFHITGEAPESHHQQRSPIYIKEQRTPFSQHSPE